MTHTILHVGSCIITVAWAVVFANLCLYELTHPTQDGRIVWSNVLIDSAILVFLPIVLIGALCSAVYDEYCESKSRKDKGDM